MILIFTSILYVFTLYVLSESFKNIPKKTNSSASHCTFSIVIAFRNEEKNLVELLESIKNIEYPSNYLQLIFCDDHSTDGGFNIISKYQNDFPFEIKLLSNEISKNGKKAALANGIHHSDSEFIITTDADCSFHPQWISSFNNLLATKKYKMILGPVVYQSNSNQGILDTYQSIENAGLVAIGSAALQFGKPFMANGANLCFQKEAFINVHGYEGNEQIVSGDDEFLLNKFHNQFPGEIGFNKSADSIVNTYTQDGFRAMLNQRIRWASKGKFKTNKFVFIIQISILIFYICVLSNLFVSAFIYATLPLLLKIAADLYFFKQINAFFHLSIRISDQIVVSILQLLITPIIAFASIFGRFNWKNREYKA